MTLVSAGAEVNEPDQTGCTPLHYSAASQAFSRLELSETGEAIQTISVFKGGHNAAFLYGNVCVSCSVLSLK